MSDDLKGSCWCGATQFTHPGEIKFSLKCYCRDCQHISGGGHLPQIMVSRSALTLTGPVKIYSQKSDSGNTLEFTFCGTCGSPLLKSTTMAPEMIAICAGAIDSTQDLDFGNKVFEDCRKAWDKD